VQDDPSLAQGTSTASAATNEVSAASYVPSQMQPTIQLIAFVLPTPPNDMIAAEIREYTASDGLQCNAAALLRPVAPYAVGNSEAPLPARSVSPLLAALLAPLPSSIPQSARMAAIRAILGPSVTHATLNHVAPIARAGGYNVLGCALHAATFGACMEPHHFTPVTDAILEAGGPVDATLLCEPASARTMAPQRNPPSGGASEAFGTTDSTHWLSGATCLHIAALFGLQHGNAILPLLRLLRDAHASPCAVLPLLTRAESVMSFTRQAITCHQCTWHACMLMLAQQICYAFVQ
jgi:hypothetical protein